MIDAIVLDAMGVLYEHADDVADLLIPFCRASGSSLPPDAISRLYRASSLGELSPEEFWRRVGLSATAEREYLGLHRVRRGAKAFLRSAAAKGVRLACVTNDVARWSTALRKAHGLEALIPIWVVSGEVGARKPDEAIYQRALSRLELAAARCLFVDDRQANVQEARRLGFHAVCFGSDGVGDFASLSDHIAQACETSLCRVDAAEAL